MRVEYNDEALTFSEPFITDAIQLFVNNVPEAIDFLQNECSADQFAWISEIIESIAESSGSVELAQVYADLMSKFPEETEKYHISSFAESAIFFAEETAERKSRESLKSRQIESSTK